MWYILFDYYAISGLRLFEPQDQDGNVGTEHALAGKILVSRYGRSTITIYDFHCKEI